MLTIQSPEKSHNKLPFTLIDPSVYSTSSMATLVKHQEQARKGPGDEAKKLAKKLAKKPCARRLNTAIAWL